MGARIDGMPGPSETTRSPGAGPLMWGTSLAGLTTLVWGMDPIALLSFQALIAPAVGFALARAGCSMGSGAATSVLWSLAVLASAELAGGMPAPLWGSCVVIGLLYAGFGLGYVDGRGARAFGVGARLCLLFTALVAALPLSGALGGGGAPLAERHPGLAALLLDASPVGLALECAGVDWMHGDARVYRHGGVEWLGGPDVVRRPWRGMVAGPAVLLVGCAIGAMLASCTRRRSGVPGSLPTRQN